MSGIAGIKYLDNSLLHRADLVLMLDTLAHRGPDGADIWVDGNIGLGHRMLWTTPESLIEKQPLVDRVRNLAIAADARIDNREELISQLSLDNSPSDRPLNQNINQNNSCLKTVTDSQLILEAYKKWGEDCLEYLVGDFAFAIWDGCKQTLFCARDHFGVKPFYYYQSDQVFIFASEIKALLCLPQVPC
ncbi:MAG: asparagine synthetase B, partial [Cyanobacteria bacterium J06639_18]